MSELNSITCPLAGASLVEAAAGTGKTYNIQNLVLRMVVEKNWPIEKIVVVTFTVAATAELKERIRRILRALADSFDAVEAVGEKELPRVRAMRERFAECGLSDSEVRSRVRQALLGFDDAGIATIHGFCQKVLSEYAFESGSLFSLELAPDAQDLIRPLVEDFYRSFFYCARLKEFRQTVEQSKWITPEQLLDDVTRLLDSETEPYWGAFEPGDPDEMLDEFARAFESAQALCDLTLLEPFVPFFKKELESAYLAAAAILRDGNTSKADRIAALTALDYENIVNGIKRNSKAAKMAAEDFSSSYDLSHPFFAAVGILIQVRESIVITLRRAALIFVREHLAELKTRDRVQTFNDLLVRVRDEAIRNERFVAALRGRYAAAILDEFQDTDAIQYEFFDRVFGQSPDHSFFMVGDPKQAIYSFRGGDIATYMRAAGELERRGGRRYTLLTNFRSSAPMVRAVNDLFSGPPDPFLSDCIRFERVRAHAEEQPGEEPYPLRFILRPEAAKSKGELTQWAVEACASRVLALLQEKCCRPSDIAILVFTGPEADNIAEELGKRHIPSVVMKKSSVFDSEEAAELALILEALEQPERSACVGRALLSPLCGAVPGDFTGNGGTLLIDAQEEFKTLRTLCIQGSFTEMFRKLLDDFEIREKLVRSERGERRLTNLLHLGEILHRQSMRCGSLPSVLLKFLNSQRDIKSRVNAEEHELLLETDHAAVRIMTVHKSKGLSFPVVMLPTLFAQTTEDTLRPGQFKANRFYDPVLQRMRPDLSLKHDRLRESKFARMQELLRLAYVALTRAEKRCELFWGDVKNNCSPLDYLTRAARLDRIPRADCLKEILNEECSSAASLLPPEWCTFFEASEIGFYRHFELDDPDLSCRTWHGDMLERSYRVNSFSSFAPKSTGHRAVEEDRDVDFDDDSTSNGPVEAPDAIFTIPGGAALGLAWHAIFEKIDFAASDDALRAVAENEMRTYLAGFDNVRKQEFLETTVRMVRRTLNQPLNDGYHQPFTLGEVRAHDRLSELEFTYGLKGHASPQSLRELLKSYAAGRFGHTEWPDGEQALGGGYMTGFIDLIFRRGERCFILDWKSNALGGNPEAFRRERLREPMCEQFYFVQYLIYSVALIKYLRLHLGRFGEAEYERYYGGVYYLFLRGCGGANHEGVFYDRPPWAVLSALEELIG